VYLLSLNFTNGFLRHHSHSGKFLTRELNFVQEHQVRYLVSAPGFVPNKVCAGISQNFFESVHAYASPGRIFLIRPVVVESQDRDSGNLSDHIWVDLRSNYHIENTFHRPDFRVVEALKPRTSFFRPRHSHVWTGLPNSSITYFRIGSHSHSLSHKRWPFRPSIR